MNDDLREALLVAGGFVVAVGGGIVVVDYLNRRAIASASASPTPAAAYTPTPTGSSSSSSSSSQAQASASSSGRSNSHGFSTYTVQNGDTLSAIAARFGTTYQSIAEANGIVPPYTIYPGQVLKIPSGAARSGVSGAALPDLTENSLWKTPTSNKVYIYRNGQLHWICSESLAAAYGISLANINVVSALPASVGTNFANCHSSSNSSGVAENSLWKTPNSSKVYIAQDGELHWICSESVAAAHGIALTNIHVVDTLPLKIGTNFAGCSPSSSPLSSGSGSTPFGRPPYGFFYIGFHCGLPLFVPAIPHLWPSTSPIPAAGTNQVAWVRITGPKNAPGGGLWAVDARTKAHTTLVVIASYDQNGQWTGSWAVVRNQFGTKPFLGNPNPAANQGWDVCFASFPGNPSVF